MRNGKHAHNLMLCRGKTASGQIDAGELNAESPVIEIPYIGPILNARFNNEQMGTVNDVVQRFSPDEPLSVQEIEILLGNLCRNPRRNQCVHAVNGTRVDSDLYHAADVNVCAFNSIIDLLRYAHENWENVNVPGATDVPLRSRGTNQNARVCGCKPEDECIAAAGECTWNTAEQTQMTDSDGNPMGYCTPRGPRNGFRGRPEPWDEGQIRPELAQYTMVNTTAGPSHDVAPDNTRYVRRWRVVGTDEPPENVAGPEEDVQELGEEEVGEEEEEPEEEEPEGDNPPVASRTRSKTKTVADRVKERRRNKNSSGSNPISRWFNRWFYGLEGGGDMSHVIGALANNPHEMKHRILEMEKLSGGQKNLRCRRMFNIVQQQRNST